MARERVSFTFDPREMLFSLQTGFGFVRAPVACAIVERTSEFEPSSQNTAPRSLKVVTVPSVCPFYLLSPPEFFNNVCHHFGLLNTDLHLIPFAGFVESSTRASSSCSSSANHKLVLFLPPMLIFLPFSSNAPGAGWETYQCLISCRSSCGRMNV